MGSWFSIFIIFSQSVPLSRNSFERELIYAIPREPHLATESKTHNKESFLIYRKDQKVSMSCYANTHKNQTKKKL